MDKKGSPRILRALEPAMPAIDAAVLTLPVRGRNLRLGPLSRQVSPGPTLLVFLRHFG